MPCVTRLSIALSLSLLLILQQCISTLSSSSISPPLASFNEKLIVKPFLDGKVLLHFQFSTIDGHQDHQGDEEEQQSSQTEKKRRHYTLLPKMLGQIVDKYHVNEMQLSLTQGRWQYDKWGVAYAPAPVGAELITWFSPQSANNATTSSSDDVEQNWKGLVNALSGLFCASLNFLDTTTEFSYAAGVVSNGDSFRYGTLSQETVCTENLTPFKQLLPSRAKAGIGALLNPIRLYDSHFHSMGVHYRRLNNGCDELVQTVSVVFDVNEMGKQHTGDLIFKDFTLFSLLGYVSNANHKHKIPKFVLANHSSILLDMSHELQSYMIHSSAHVVDSSDNRMKSMLQMYPEPLASSQTSIELTSKESTNRTNNITSDGSAMNRISIVGQENHVLTEVDLLTLDGSFVPNVEFKWIANKIPIPVKYPVQSAITAQRYETGHGQKDGGFVVHIQNNDPRREISIQYYDAIPWYFKLYLHTLQLRINDELITDPVRHCSHFNVVPSKDRVNSAVVQFVVSMPPMSNLSLSIEFEKAFLKYTEHSPDANRGFDLSSSVISYSLLDGDQHHSLHSLFDFCPVDMIPSQLQHGRQQQPRSITNTRLYTDSLLITLPKPDFSMPYNVITLSSTIIALFFGSLFNVLIRRFKMDKSPPLSSQTTAEQ